MSCNKPHLHLTSSPTLLYPNGDWGISIDLRIYITLCKQLTWKKSNTPNLWIPKLGLKVKWVLQDYRCSSGWTRDQSLCLEPTGVFFKTSQQCWRRQDYVSGSESLDRVSLQMSAKMDRTQIRQQSRELC